MSFFLGPFFVHSFFFIVPDFLASLADFRDGVGASPSAAAVPFFARVRASWRSCARFTVTIIDPAFLTQMA